MSLSLALDRHPQRHVVAQASALAKEENLDSTPSRYYKDSPVLIKDKVVEGYARTTSTPPGQNADPYYMERIGVATVITEATSLYNAERYQDALGQYKTALATPQGQQLRAESGLYLTSIKLGNTVEAEQAFGRIVALGIAYNELGVKFLFAPGSVDFWTDPKISGAYQMWLRQIARGAVAAGSCMTIVGHTSKSGPAADQRRAVAEAGRDDQAEARRRAARARGQDQGRGHGLPAEHRRQRHRQQLRRARSASRVQDRALPVRPLGVST